MSKLTNSPTYQNATLLMSKTYQCQTNCQERRQSSSNYTGGIGADTLANVQTTFINLFGFFLSAHKKNLKTFKCTFRKPKRTFPKSKKNLLRQWTYCRLTLASEARLLYPKKLLKILKTYVEQVNNFLLAERLRKAERLLIHAVQWPRTMDMQWTGTEDTQYSLKILHVILYWIGVADKIFEMVF